MFHRTFAAAQPTLAETVPSSLPAQSARPKGAPSMSATSAASQLADLMCDARKIYDERRAAAQHTWDSRHDGPTWEGVETAFTLSARAPEIDDRIAAFGSFLKAVKGVTHVVGSMRRDETRGRELTPVATKAFEAAMAEATDARDAWVNAMTPETVAKTDSHGNLVETIRWDGPSAARDRLDASQVELDALTTAESEANSLAATRAGGSLVG